MEEAKEWAVLGSPGDSRVRIRGHRRRYKKLLMAPWRQFSSHRREEPDRPQKGAGRGSCRRIFQRKT